MKLTNILEDNAMLFEQHKKYSQQTLTESCNGLNALQRTIIEGIHKDLTPLVDASLSANRVDRLLNCATTKERNNMLFDSINNHIKKIDKWCINSSPITDFSDRFTRLAETITTQFNSNYIISESLNALYQYSNEYPSQRATILGLLTSIASLSPSNYGVTIAEQLLTKSIDLSNYVVESVEPQYANSTTTTAKVLTEGQVYLIFDKVCDRNNRALSESKLIDVADPYTPKTSMWDKVQDKQGYLESRYTSVLTPSTLTKLWEEAGSPQRAGDLAIFLGNSRINGVVVQKTFESLRIPLTSHDLQLLSEGPFGQAVARGTRKAAANVGAIAGGIAGIPSAVKRGFNIGKKRVGGRGAGNTQADPNAANQTDPNAANQTDPNAANQTSGSFMSDFKNGYRQGRTGKLDAAPDDSTPDSTDSSTTSGGKGKITPQDERIYQQIKYNYDQLSVPVKQKIVKALSSNSKTLVNPAQDEEEGQAQVRDLGVPQQQGKQGTSTPQQQGKQGTSTPQQQGKQGTSTPQQQGTGTPPTGPNTPPAKQGTSTTPQQGTGTPPTGPNTPPAKQGTSTPPAGPNTPPAGPNTPPAKQGTSTTPQQGTGTPQQQGTGTPQQQGTGTPQQQGTGTPPTGPNTPPAKQGTGTPQQQGTNTVNTRVPRMSAPNSRVNQQPVSSKKKEVDNGPSPEQVRKDKQAAARDRIDQEFGVRTPDPTNLMLPHETPGDVRNRLQQAVIRDRIDQEFGVRTPDPRPTSTASPGQTRIQRLPAALDRVDREFNDPTINPPAKQGTNTPPAKQGTNTPPAKQGTSTPPAGPNTPPAGPNTPPAKQGTSTPPAKQGTSTPPAKQGTSTPPAGPNTPPAKQGTSTPPAGPNTPPAKQGTSTPPAKQGTSTPPAGPNTPPAGPNTPPAGPNTPPAGPNTPPAKQGTSTPPAGPNTPPAKQGTSTPPAGPNTPPAGPNTPPAGPNTPPAGPNTPPAKQGTSTPPAGPNTPPAKQGTSTPPAKQGTSTPPAGPNTPPAKQGTSTSSQISTPNSGVNQRPSSVNNAVDSNIDDTKATTIQGKRAPPLPTLKTDNSLPSQVRNRKQAAARNRIDLEFNSPTTYPQRAPLKDLDRTAYDSPPGTKGNYTSNSRTPTNASVGKSFTANTNPNSTSNYGTQNAGTASYNAPKAKTPTTDFSVKRYDDTKPTTIQGKRAPPLPTLRAKPTATSFSDNTTTQQKPATNKVKNDLANSGKSKKNNRSNRLNKKLNRLSKVSDSVEYNIERMISENFSMFRDHRKDLTEAPVGTIKNAINKAVEVPANAFVRGSAAVSNTINAGVNAIRNTQDAVKSVGNFGYRGRAKPSSYDNDDRSYGDVDYGNDVNESIYVKQALSKIFAGRRLKPEDINNIKSFLDKIDRYQFKMSIDHTGTKQVLNKLLNNETLTYNDTTIARALFKAI